MNRNNIAEKEIKEILKKISYSETLSEQGWLGGELKLPNLEQGWEIAFKYGEQIFVVEYDDDKHYRNTLTIKADLEKDRISKELGYEIIRVPYWIAMDTIMVEYYFGIEFDVETTNKHGFNEDDLFPASFCEKGIERFSQELKMLPGEIKYEIIMSLREKIKEHGTEYVIPKSLKII